MVICESGTGEKILDILLLGEVDAVRRGRDLKTKKVMKRTKIRHQELELITEAHLHKVNELRVVTGDDHVINIEKKKCATTSISDNRGEVLKLGPRSLLEAI